MKYDREDRRAIARLVGSPEIQFRVLEQYECGELISIPRLCKALTAGPTFVLFTCLSGDATTQALGRNFGVPFVGSKRRIIEGLEARLRKVGYTSDLTVIVDDCEPRRVWNWSVPQQEITEWCSLILNDARERSIVPPRWRTSLWSEIESASTLDFSTIVSRIRESRHALVLHHHLTHMKKHPNKKLKGDVVEAAVRRVAGYALQGLVLERVYPHAILLQTEFPWSAKDAPYSTLRSTPLPIVHPFPDERG